MRAVFPAFLVILTVCSLTAQKPVTPPQAAPTPQTPIPGPTSRLKSNQYAIAVQGCVQNGRIRIATSQLAYLPFDTLNASEFILEGPKELLQQIQEQHNRHYDEIEGVATVPPPPNDSSTSVTTTRKGPVQIEVGSREEKGPVIVSTLRPIKLRVASLTHLSEGCVARP